MTDEEFGVICQKIIDCNSGMELVKLGENLNEIPRNEINYRDFAIIQSLILSKGNELAMTNVLDVLDTLQASLDMGFGDVPSKNEQH